MKHILNAVTLAACFTSGLLSHSALAAENQITITEEDGYRYIIANGIPDHATGDNLRTEYTEQGYDLRVTMTPELSGTAVPAGRSYFGIGLNGIPFDTGTAECYGVKIGAGADLSAGACQWNIEAIDNSGASQVGLDENNAHVKPTGAYHYHGSPTGLTDIVADGSNDLTLVGYAADGFGIYVSAGEAYTTSYSLKEGDRPDDPDGPDGPYDGTYQQDYEYLEGTGDLDDCNGIEVNGQYSYIITDTYPYIPRCWKGTADESFVPTGGPPEEEEEGTEENDNLPAEEGDGSDDAETPGMPGDESGATETPGTTDGEETSCKCDRAR